MIIDVSMCRCKVAGGQFILYLFVCFLHSLSGTLWLKRQFLRTSDEATYCLGIVMLKLSGF